MLEKTKYSNDQEAYKHDGNKLTYYCKNGNVKAEGPFENNQIEIEF